METSSLNTESSLINAKSVHLLLETSLNEYSNEHDRKATIDSKAGIALPIISAFFLSFAQMNDYKSIVSMPLDSFGTSLLPSVLFLSYTGGLVLSMLSVALMAKVLFVKDYYRINPVDLYTDDNLTKQEADLSITLMHKYFHAISFNREVNTNRTITYQRSWTLAFVSVILFVIYIVIKNNF